MDVEGARILITGASRGIGRAVALAMAPGRPVLVLLGRAQAALDEVARLAAEAGAEVETVALDLTDERAPEEAAAAAGEISALVHSAGVCPLGSVEATGAAALDASWAVNLRAPYLLTARCLPALRRTGGHVVFINSGAGRVARAGWSAYAAAKHGLKALADALREEEGPQGVRVTSVFPGRTATDMQRAVHEQEGKAYDPGRFVRAEDVAAAVRLALSTAPPASVDEIVIRPT